MASAEAGTQRMAILFRTHSYSQAHKKLDPNIAKNQGLIQEVTAYPLKGWKNIANLYQQESSKHVSEGNGLISFA